MTTAELGDLLARVNAGLNGTSFVLLLAGFALVRAGRLEAHRRAMTGAFGASVVFLLSYATRFALTGSHRFAGTGALKVVYLAVLLSHMVLAVATVPLVLRALWLASKDRRAEHRRIARVTFPIWSYVSLTGVVVYVLLYHVGGIAH
jgi:putative membrane protein